MPANTTRGIPYVLPADALLDYPQTSQDLADAISDPISRRWAKFGVGSSGPHNGYPSQGSALVDNWTDRGIPIDNGPGYSLFGCPFPGTYFLQAGLNLSISSTPDPSFYGVEFSFYSGWGQPAFLLASGRFPTLAFGTETTVAASFPYNGGTGAFFCLNWYCPNAGGINYLVRSILIGLVDDRS